MVYAPTLETDAILKDWLLYVIPDAKVSENPVSRINPVGDVASQATQRPPSAVNPSLVTRVLSGCKHFSADLAWCQKHAVSVDDFLQHHTGVREPNVGVTDCHNRQLRLQTESQTSSLSSDDARTSRELPEQSMNRLCISSPHFHSTCGSIFQPVKLFRRKDSDETLPAPAFCYSESDAIPLKVIGGSRGLRFLHLLPAATAHAAGDRRPKLLSCLYPLRPGNQSHRSRNQLEIVDLGSTYKVRLCSTSDNQLSGRLEFASSLQPDSGNSPKPNVDLGESVRHRVEEGRAVDVLNPSSLFGIRQRLALGTKTRSPRKSRDCSGFESVSGSKLQYSSPWTSSPLLCPDAARAGQVDLGQPAGWVDASTVPPESQALPVNKDLSRGTGLPLNADMAERTDLALNLGLSENNSGVPVSRDLPGNARYLEYAGLLWDTCIPLGLPDNTGATLKVDKTGVRLSPIDLVEEPGNSVSACIAEDRGVPVGLLGDTTAVRDGSGSIHTGGTLSSNEPPSEFLLDAALPTSAEHSKSAAPDLQMHRITCPSLRPLQDPGQRTATATDSSGGFDANKSHSACHVVTISKESSDSNP